MEQKPLEGQENETCSYCGHKGHWRPDCRELAEDNARGCQEKIKETINKSSFSAGLSALYFMRRTIYNFLHEGLRVRHKWAFKVATLCYYDIRGYYRHKRCGLFR